MSEEQTDKEIKDRLHQIFPSPEIASQIVNIVTNKKPTGWGRKSNAPYYNEWCGKQIKVHIDQMMESRNPIIYRYGTFCDIEGGISRKTLYNKINQSIRYLVEKMDTSDGMYARWYEAVFVETIPNTGVQIRFKSEDSFTPDSVLPREQMPEWKRLMEEWIEGDSARPFVVERLVLTPEEVRQFKIEFSQISNIMASVDCCSIKLIRVNG